MIVIGSIFVRRIVRILRRQRLSIGPGWKVFATNLMDTRWQRG